MRKMWSGGPLGTGVHIFPGRICPESVSSVLNGEKWCEFQHVRKIRFCACVFKCCGESGNYGGNFNCFPNEFSFVGSQLTVQLGWLTLQHSQG